MKKFLLSEVGCMAMENAREDINEKIIIFQIK
jgi:hypothetical protein